MTPRASWPGQSDLSSLPGVSEDEQRRLLVNHNFKRHPIGSAGKPFFYAAAATPHPYLLDFSVEPHMPIERTDGGDGEQEVFQFFIGTDYKLWPHGDSRIDMQSALERSCNKFTVELATIALAVTVFDPSPRRALLARGRRHLPQPSQPGRHRGPATQHRETLERIPLSPYRNLKPRQMHC